MKMEAEEDVERRLDVILEMHPVCRPQEFHSWFPASVLCDRAAGKQEARLASRLQA